MRPCPLPSFLQNEAAWPGLCRGIVRGKGSLLLAAQLGVRPGRKAGAESVPGTAVGARGVRRSVPGCAASPSTAERIPAGGWGAGLESHSAGYALPASTVGLSARGALPWSVCGSWFPPASHRGTGAACLTGSWEAWERRAEWAAVLCQRHLGFLWNWAVPALQELPPLCYSSWQEGGSLRLGMQALAEGSYFGVFTGLCHSARHL